MAIHFSNPDAYCMKTPVELIATEVNQPPELRFFQRPSNLLTTVASNISPERSDIVIYLPGNVPLANMSLIVESVVDAPPTTTIVTRWGVAGNSNVVPTPTPNVDIMGFYVNTAVSVPLDGTWATVNNWSTSVSSPFLTYSEIPSPGWTPSQNLKINGAFNLGFTSTGNFGSRRVRVQKNASTIALVEDQPNANAGINVHVVVPFVTDLTTSDLLSVDVTSQGSVVLDPVFVCPGLTCSYMGSSIVTI